MRLDKDTPILSGMILDLGHARDLARARAESLEQMLADVEALHEPDGNGDCPTCGTTAPCLTHLLIRREINLDQAYSVLRDHQPLDITENEEQSRPPVPSLAQLLEAPSPGLDRFFDALMRDPGQAPEQRAS